MKQEEYKEKYISVGFPGRFYNLTSAEEARKEIQDIPEKLLRTLALAPNISSDK